MGLTLIAVVFGREREGVEVSDIEGTLTQALIERERERRRWWRPWRRLEIEGYVDPFGSEA
jgi:tRNA C32,U32 (ribose-2'-O)-methylase TrmJ